MIAMSSSKGGTAAAMAAPAACFIVIRCYLVCSAAAMPLARVSNCSLVRSVVAWRMRVMAKLCLATIAGYIWQPSGAFAIVLPTATCNASQCIGARTNLTAERGFSCMKLVSLSRQCTGFAAMQGCSDHWLDDVAGSSEQCWHAGRKCGMARMTLMAC